MNWSLWESKKKTLHWSVLVNISSLFYQFTFMKHLVYQDYFHSSYSSYLFNLFPSHPFYWTVPIYSLSMVSRSNFRCVRRRLNPKKFFFSFSVSTYDGPSWIYVLDNPVAPFATPSFVERWWRSTTVGTRYPDLFKVWLRLKRLIFQFFQI